MKGYNIESYISKEVKSQCSCTFSAYDLPTSFVSVDFETLYAQRVSACSIGMVKYIDGKITDRYYSLIRPPFNYNGKCGCAITWVHGFTESDLENEMTFKELHSDIESFIGDFPLVAHNASVERACFRETIEYYGIESTINYNTIFDTLPISKIVEKKKGVFIDGVGTHTLDAVCRRFGIKELHHHNALDDAEMCGNLVLRFVEVLNGDFILDSQNFTESVLKHINDKYLPEDRIPLTNLEEVDDNPFKGCSVVLTGFSKNCSQEYGHILKELGAKVCVNVSSKTSWLICGSTPGPKKLEYAKEKGISIINECEFLNIINNI